MFALLVNSNNPNAEGLIKDLQAAGPTSGKQIVVLRASTEREIDRQFRLDATKEQPHSEETLVVH